MVIQLAYNLKEEMYSDLSLYIGFISFIILTKITVSNMPEMITKAHDC